MNNGQCFFQNLKKTATDNGPTGLREEGVEGVIATADGLVRRHLTIGLDSVLEAV